jgi:hypothetical protein
VQEGEEIKALLYRKDDIDIRCRKTEKTWTAVDAMSH